MLPRLRRIQRKDILTTLNQSRRFNSPHFLLYLLKNGLNKPTKISFSISKKVCQKAVGRNKQRRRAYSVVTKIVERLSPSYLCLVSFKNVKPLPAFKELEEEIISLLTDSGVLS